MIDRLSIPVDWLLIRQMLPPRQYLDPAHNNTKIHSVAYFYIISALNNSCLTTVLKGYVLPSDMVSDLVY